MGQACGHTQHVFTNYGRQKYESWNEYLTSYEHRMSNYFSWHLTVYQHLECKWDVIKFVMKTSDQGMDFVNIKIEAVIELARITKHRL